MSEAAVERRVPGRFWYVIAGLIFFGSLIVPVPVALWSLFAGEETAPRLIAPETKTFSLSRGAYTVFSDSRAVINGEIVISQGSISGLRVTVRSAGGREIPVEAASIGSRYNYGGQTGFAVLQFSIPESGEYTIAAEYRDKSANDRALLSIRKDFIGGLVGTILLTVGLSLLGTFLAVFIFLRTLWQRRAVMMQGVVNNIRTMSGQAKQAQERPRYSPPGSAEPKSPVEHQYDRDK
ncbi:MAG: hypothetical protein KIT15_12180 [Xanthobacteraceae bacterium]|nr:hypothetical protein [Xanthobacteraceae bacterium]MCW5675327.1 hypothetical protein [Xanthobacteraceae bacterium]